MQVYLPWRRTTAACNAFCPFGPEKERFPSLLLSYRVFTISSCFCMMANRYIIGDAPPSWGKPANSESFPMSRSTSMSLFPTRTASCRACFLSAAVPSSYTRLLQRARDQRGIWPCWTSPLVQRSAEGCCPRCSPQRGGGSLSRRWCERSPRNYHRRHTRGWSIMHGVGHWLSLE